jgi:hypothetical protein
VEKTREGPSPQAGAGPTLAALTRVVHTDQGLVCSAGMTWMPEFVAPVRDYSTELGFLSDIFVSALHFDNNLG